MHCSNGYLVLALAFTLSAIDLFAGVGRVFSYVRDRELSFRSFWNRVILSQGGDHVSGITNPEYTSLVMEESEELEIPKTRAYRGHRFVAATTGDANIHETHQWVNKVRLSTEALPESPVYDTFAGHRFSRDSQDSDDTLQDQDQDHVVKDIPLSRRVGQVVFGTLQRFLVFAGFAQLMHGIVIYTGGCRGNYLNGCLAHIISELIINFSDSQHSSSARGWHFLVLWPCHLCSFPRIILRIRLGMELRALWPACLRGIRRVVCDFRVRDNQYVDGALWRAPWRPLYKQTDSAHKHRCHVLVRRFGWDGS